MTDVCRDLLYRESGSSNDTNEETEQDKRDLRSNENKRRETSGDKDGGQNATHSAFHKLKTFFSLLLVYVI